VLGTADHGSAVFGGFAGFNTQWQDVILGLEANVEHTSFSLHAANNPITRVVSAGGDTDTVTITGSGSVTNLDFLALRARAGWVLGNFLPYGFVGFALGRADVAVSATLSFIPEGYRLMHVIGTTSEDRLRVRPDHSFSFEFVPSAPGLYTFLFYTSGKSGGRPKPRAAASLWFE